MSRQIKFRAWSKLHQSFIDDDYTHVLLRPSGKIEWYSAKKGYEPIDDIVPDDIEIMQFTGLKDRNGVDIYEGDIVRHGPEDKPNTYTVIFKDGEFTLDWPMMFLKNNSVYVIGNIYENPELLEGTK